MRKVLVCGVLGAIIMACLLFFASDAYAAITLKSIIVSPTTVTISGASGPVNLTATAVIERGNDTGDTNAVSINWGLTGTGGQLGGGAIAIGAGAGNNVGTGSGTFTVSSGTYSTFASMGTGNVTGNSVVVTSNSIPTPTQAAKITSVDGNNVTEGTPFSLTTNKTEVKIFGTCQFSGQTIEVQLDSSVVGSVTTTGTNWAYTVTIPKDGASHAIAAVTGAGLTSNSVSVKSDMVPPVMKITYSPAAMPFGVSTINVTMTTGTDNVATDSKTSLSVITPEGTPIPLTLTPVPAGAYASTFTTSLAITRSDKGKPVINSVPSQNGTFQMYAVAVDEAGNTGTATSSGGSFTVNVSGPSSAGARVSVEGDAQFTNNRRLNFIWSGFSHAVSVDNISKFWYIASQTKPANADTADVVGWTDGGAGASGGGNNSISAGSDGTWEIYVKAQDAQGNFSTSVSDSIIVDTIGPSVTSGSNVPAANYANATDQTEIICVITDMLNGATLSGVNRNTVVMTVNGTQYGLGGTGSTNASPALSMDNTGRLIFQPQIIGLKYPRGNVSVSVTADDNIGNHMGATSGGAASPFQWTFIVNTNADAPIPNNPQPAANLYYKDKRPTIILHANDSDGLDKSSVIMNVTNGSSFMTFNVGPNLTLADPAAGGTDSVLTLTPPTDFIDGTVSVTLRAKDKVGNEMAPYSWTFYVDTTAPVPSSPSPANNTVVTSTQPVISLKIDDASGLDTSTESVTLRVNYISLANPSSSASHDYTIDSTDAPGLTYNASTKTLVFSSSIATNLTLGVGSVEVVLVRARDRAVAPPSGATPSPNSLTEQYKWAFSIATSAGPVVSNAESTPAPPTSATVYNVSNLEPLVIRTTLVDEDLIDHNSVLIDVNGRTFRNGDAQVSFVSSATNEVLVVDLKNDAALVKQGTNEITLRAANDRTGRALQNAPVNLSFVYDNIGPEGGTPVPDDGGIIYDLNNGPIKCGLSDSGTGVSKVALEVRDNGVLLERFGTDSTPVYLVYDSTNKQVIFRPRTPFVADHKYDFSIVPPTSATANDGTVDRAGNGIGKAANSTATAARTWSLTAAGTASVVLLNSPANDQFVNVRNKDFKFSWKSLTGASKYRIEIAGNLTFKDPYKYETVAVEFSEDTLQNQLLAHGKIYYWQVSAVDASGQSYGTSERRQFTVDAVAPQSPKIVGVIDYLGLNPKHENQSPLSSTTYVKQRRIRIKALLFEGAAGTVGYSLSAGYLNNVLTTTPQYIELGTNIEVHGNDTNEIDITLPDVDGEYRIVAYVLDRASNYSVQSELARVYLNRKVPKINSIILTDPSPNSNGYVTSGKIKFEVVFNTPIDMLPLNDYIAKPSVKFDPKSAEGTVPIELTDLAVSGKSITGYGYVPYGKGDQFDGMADVIVTGFMDASWNAMDGGSVTYYKYFEIDTAPGFEVKTFLNPVDEKNVLINIQASETLLFVPACYITFSNGDVNQVAANIMAKNLFATSLTSSVGENNIRISGLDTRNNIGYWPPADVIKDGKFLMAKYNVSSGSTINSRDMGLNVEIPKRSIAKDSSIYVFPYKLEYVGNDYLASVAMKKNVASKRMAALENISESGEALKIKTANNKMMTITGNDASNAEIKVENITEPVNGTAIQAELEQVSSFYEIAPARELKVDGKISLECRLDENLKAQVSKMDLYYSADGILWERANASYDGEKFNAKMKSTGVFGVFLDKKAPVFKEALNGRQKLDSTKPELFSYVSDFGAGINSASAVVKIDGEEYKAGYDANGSRLTYVPEMDLSSGNHEIVFEISDFAGNVSRQAVTVVVPAVDPSIVNAISYPNPARGNNATISFDVNGTLGAVVDAQVYVYDVNANLVCDLMVMQTGNKFKANWLGLRNEDGEIVANGVYIYKIKINCADKKVEKYGKLAVLR